MRGMRGMRGVLQPFGSKLTGWQPPLRYTTPTKARPQSRIRTRLPRNYRHAATGNISVAALGGSVAVVDRVTTRNRRVDVGRAALVALAAVLWLQRALLVALAGVLWLLGWLVGKVCAAPAWVAAAVKVGWMDARATPRRTRP